MLWNLLSRTPELASGLPRKYSEGEAIFDARVKQRFPPGTAEHILMAELARQGFELDKSAGAYRSATFSRGFILRTIWSVRWKSSGGQVEDIFAIYGVIAP